MTLAGIGSAAILTERLFFTRVSSQSDSYEVSVVQLVITELDGCRRGIKFLELALLNDTGECIIWPFYIMKEGYGQVGTASGMVLAHRYVCERTHGPAPVDKPQAAHFKCGNKPCVNKKHLRWASQTDNEDDKLNHGTWLDRISGDKWSDYVLLIRADDRAGLSYDRISVKYGIPISTVKKIARRETWKHIL